RSEKLREGREWKWEKEQNEIESAVCITQQVLSDPPVSIHLSNENKYNGIERR
ncbi:hypothetical protein LOAG_15122, partial [Loa loa]